MESDYLSVLVSDDHVRIDHSYNNALKNSGNIVIWNNCWLGVHEVVTVGREVGSGVCIGAGAVVHGQYPLYTFIGGILARKIKGFDA